MGISQGAIKLLAKTLQGQRYNNVATYGVQEISASQQEIESALSEYNISWITQSKDNPSTQLFKSLGCTQVESIDFYPDEKPTYTMDLNLPIDNRFQEKFDLIYDGGTLEHCFDIAQVLRNTASMIKTSGRIIHHVPTNNWVDHGFYQASPTLFFDFYEAAGFSDFSFHFHFMNKKRERYIPYNLNDDPPPYSIGKGIRVLSHFSAVKKHSIDPTKITSLIQRRYREYFSGEQNLANAPRRDVISRLKRSIRKRTILLRSKRL